MGRRLADSDVYRFTLAVLFLIAAGSCFMSYYSFSISFKGSTGSDTVSFGSTESSGSNEEENGCCRGIEHLELWGDAVKWGSDFKLNSSRECCEACKEMCKGDDGPCLCDSWVFCGDKEACGSRFGEGIVKLNTVYGAFHVKLLPDCAPHSVAYILELLSLNHCAGCQFYRAESRGNSWDPQGNHIEHASFGPPYALIQGIVEAQGTVFKDIPLEACPPIRRGSIAWVGSGPEFFISLANHNEWRKSYSVFGFVLPKDMEIVEQISQLPTIPDVWSTVKVSVLERPVPLRFIRLKKNS